MGKGIQINEAALSRITALLADGNNPLIEGVAGVLEKYGNPAELNERAAEAGRLETLMRKMELSGSPYLNDIQWLREQREKGAFISVPEYRRKVLGAKAEDTLRNEANPVTLEISPLQYFPWLMREARQAAEKGEIMPGRFIRLRKMKEQEKDGELLAVRAAMKILGASCVESPETSGADGSNVHLGGPDTIAGYYGGIGAPNDYPLRWLDEVLYYYTAFGVDQFINVSYGTMTAAQIAYHMGVNIGIKVSVTMGHDSAYHLLQTLITAKLFERDGGGTALVGLNFSNSVDSDTIRLCSKIRKDFGFEEDIRFEHHITEPYLGMVRQPYLRREQLLEIALTVPNVSAKHEGGEPGVELTRDHPSNHLENFRTKDEVREAGDMEAMELNYMDKHDSLNRTARALTEKGLSFIGASNLHRPET